jgi:MFS family permease
VLAGSFLFSLGQGVLRPSLPLYLQQSFAANYRMVTLIPVVFGAGKWAANLPTGYLLDRLGRRRLMVTGLLLIAAIDLASAATTAFVLFLGLRAVGGMGWAMFGTVATTTMVDRPAADRRGRAIGLFLMSESLGLLLGSVAGGWLYQTAGTTSPFVFEAACMLVAALAVSSWPAPAVTRRDVPASAGRRLLATVLRVPGVILMSVTSAALIAIQTGALVFLFPLYLAERGAMRPETVGYVVGLGMLGRLLALWLGGSASDHWGRLPVLVPGLLGYGVLLASLVLVTDPVLLGLWSFMIGAGAGFVAGLPTAIVGDRVAPPLQGIAIGWLRTVTDAGMLVGPLVMGTLADAVHLAAAFLAAGAIAAALGWRCHRHAVQASP